MVRRKSLKDEWQFEYEAVAEYTSDRQSLPIESIILPSAQPRRYFDPDKLQQLTDSIRQHGILEPLLVRPSNQNGSYELVAGERRLKAAQAAGLTSVPVTIRSLNDEEALQLALVENLQREDLNPVEETEGILQLLALRLKIPTAEVSSLLYRMRNEEAEIVGQNVLINPASQIVKTVFAELGTLTWESFTTARLPLLRLPPDILKSLRAGKIAYTKAQAIARVKDDTQRSALLRKAITKNLSLNEIKAEIQALQPEPQLTPGKIVAQRLSEISKRLQKSQIWDDRKKKERITKLLDELEKLTTGE